MLFKTILDHAFFGPDDAGNTGGSSDDQGEETTDTPTATLDEESNDQNVDTIQDEADESTSDVGSGDESGTTTDSDAIELDPQEGSSEDMSSEDSSQTTEPSDESTFSPAPTRPYGVESWRPLVTEMAGDIPVEVLLRWIKHESGGNPCSTGKIVNGASIENGLFQLYSPDDDHIATPSQLHGSFCNGQTCTRDLTLDEARIQVASGIAYVRICRERARAQLKQAGVDWDEAGSDFWSLVKMQHNLPSVPKMYMQKLRPASWTEFKEGVLKEQPKYSQTTIFSNAEDVGAAAEITSG
jgi:hypothetical protein